MLKTGLIGVGAAGNQVVSVGLEEGLEPVDLLAINSSDIDLTSLEDKVETLVLGGQGCGKDITIAQKTIKKYLPDHLGAFNKFKEYDMVWITGATGGGTAAGMITVLAQVLKQVVGLKIGIMAIIPKHNETLASQSNTLITLKEIERLSRDLNIPYAIYDNETVQGSPIKVFQKINKEIINDFKILRGDMNNYSKYSIIDQMDNKKLIYQPGMMRIGKVSGLKQIYTEKRPLHQLILEALSISVNAPNEKDRIVGRMGFYLNLNENLLEEFDAEKKSVVEKTGKPKADYSQLNLIKEDQEGSIAVLMTGLSFPNTRVSEIVELLESAKDDVTKKLEENKYIQEKVNETSGWFSNADEVNLLDDEEPKEKVSLDDIFAGL